LTTPSRSAGPSGCWSQHCFTSAAGWRAKVTPRSPNDLKRHLAPGDQVTTSSSSSAPPRRPTGWLRVMTSECGVV
jgi:hypothetical protein